jgi:Hsp70 protein
VAVEQITAVVDFGTSHTVVAIAGPGIPARLVSVDGEPWFPSSVLWDPDGRGIVGQEALRRGRTEPDRLERRLKARVGDGQVLLGDAEVPAGVLVRAVLVRAIAEAVTAADATVAHLVLTHPVDWDPERLGVLRGAAHGLVPRVSMMAEPIAAAAWSAARHGLPAGAVLAVLDLGGGTCDAALVRRGPAGLEVLACAVLPGLGGEDIDQRLVDHVAPNDLEWSREDVRAAKEGLSRHSTSEVALPGGASLTRAEFEDLVRPDLVRAVELLDATTRAAGLTGADLTAVQLAGGSSRMPLLSELLGSWTDAPIRLDDQPEAVVALGAEAALRPQAVAPRDPDVTGPVSAAEMARLGPPEPREEPLPPRPPHIWATVAIVVVLAAMVLGMAALIDLRGSGSPVAGLAQAPRNAPRLTLPAAATGRPVAVPGRSTAALKPVKAGQFVDYVYGDKALRWRLDRFDDSAQTQRGLATLGNPLTTGYHWALVRYTVRTVDQFAEEPDLSDQLYLVDDRGLMISPLDSVKGPTHSSGNAYLPDYCPPAAGEAVRAGSELARCALFAVPDATPITEVAISFHSNSSPQPSATAATRNRGARVAVTGRDTADAEPVAARDEHSPGSAVSLRTDRFSADVAVVGLVENASAYLDERSTIILGGSRAMILRIALRLDDPVASNTLEDISAALLDERGAPIDPGVLVPTNECVDTDSAEDVSGTVALCVLFAVPAAASPSAAIVQAGGAEPEVWDLRS